MKRRPAEVKRHREAGIYFFVRDNNRARRVIEALKALLTAAFGLGGIDRARVVHAASGMDHVIPAAAKRVLLPEIYQIEDQGRMYGNHRVKAGCRLPRPIPYPAHRHAGDARRM